MSANTASQTDVSEYPDHRDYPAKTRRTPLAIIINLLRGALIGMSELVPGISGGTVALVIGVYERALHNGNLLIDLVKALIKDRGQFKKAASRVDWLFLAAIAIGMVTAVFSMSTILHNFVEGYPEISRALFLGMVIVSILVPLGMMDPRDVRRKLAVVIPLFIVAAVGSFVAIGFTAAPQTDPSLIVIFFAAALVVCALVLPGLSGSFFLMALGLYAPVMASLSAREWDVIIVFMLGALTGIALFIRVLSYVLEHHRTITLTLMAGFMFGSLRALWPWQDDNAGMLAPDGNIWPVIGTAVLGAFIVAAVIFAERLKPRHEHATVKSTDPE